MTDSMTEMTDYDRLSRESVMVKSIVYQHNKQSMTEMTDFYKKNRFILLLSAKIHFLLQLSKHPHFARLFTKTHETVLTKKKKIEGLLNSC